MEKFKQYLLATAGLVIFIGAVTLFNPVQITGAPPAKDVNVVNAPLPITGNVTSTVTGSVAVTNFPASQTVDINTMPDVVVQSGQVDANVTNTSLNVDATQSGTWNVGITNDDTNPVPVVVQNGANNDGMPFEFADTFSNPEGVPPGCVTPHDVFTVPADEIFVVTDIVLTGFTGGNFVTMQRDAVDILGLNLGIGCVGCVPTFHHTFQTGLRFGEHEKLRLTNVTRCPNNASSPRILIGFLITGIRTTS